MLRSTACLPELGAEVARYRPLRRWQAWGICTVFGFLTLGWSLLVPSPLGFAFRWLGFLGSTLLWAAVFSDTLWIEHRLHEHGLKLLTPGVPLAASYAVPYLSIDPDTISTSAWYRNRQKGVLIDRRLRQIPFLGGIRFDGLDPSAALHLARGVSSWTIETGKPVSIGEPRRPRPTRTWHLSHRDRDAFADQLRGLVVRAHAEADAAERAEIERTDAELARDRARRRIEEQYHDWTRW